MVSSTVHGCGEGDHRHYGKREEAHVFTTLTALLEHFHAMAARPACDFGVPYCLSTFSIAAIEDVVRLIGDTATELRGQQAHGWRQVVCRRYLEHGYDRR